MLLVAEDQLFVPFQLESSLSGTIICFVVGVEPNAVTLFNVGT
jgi:hypothetical protein